MGTHSLLVWNHIGLTLEENQWFWSLAKNGEMTLEHGWFYTMNYFLSGFLYWLFQTLYLEVGSDSEPKSLKNYS